MPHNSGVRFGDGSTSGISRLRQPTTNRPGHTGPVDARRRTEVRLQARPSASHEVSRPLQHSLVTWRVGVCGSRPPTPAVSPLRAGLMRRRGSAGSRLVGVCGVSRRCGDKPLWRLPACHGRSGRLAGLHKANRHGPDPGGSFAGRSCSPAFRSPFSGRGHLAGTILRWIAPRGAPGTDALRSFAPARGEGASRPPRAHMPFRRRPPRFVFVGGPPNFSRVSAAVTRWRPNVGRSLGRRPGFWAWPVGDPCPSRASTDRCCPGLCLLQGCGHHAGALRAASGEWLYTPPA